MMPLVERIALFVLLAIAGLRPLVTETFRTGGDSLMAFEGAGDPWAATTLALDGLLLVAAACILLPRIRQKRYRPCGLELGAALFVVAGIVSCVAALDRRPAINATIDWVATLGMALALAQVLERPVVRRVALAVVVAGAAVNFALGAEQLVVGFSETEQMYFQQRAEIWGRQGVPLDAPQVQLFERRLAAREVSGQFAHSNIAAAYWLLGGFAALAATALARGPARKFAALLMAGALLGICFWTGSKAALAAMLCGLALWGLFGWLGPRLATRARLAWVAGWIAVLAAAAVVVVIGIAGDGLPGSSLDFRWQYWTASARMFSDHGLTGVGAENFGDHYLAYKSLASPEEVKNPHNLAVQFATEYGILGLAALLSLLGGATWRIAQYAPVTEPAVAPEQEAGALRRWGIVLGLGILLTRIPLLPSLNPDLVLWSTCFGGLSWAAGFALLAWALAAPTAPGASRMAGAALGAGLFAFLLQDTVNFALFVPASRTTFFVLAGIAVAGRTVPLDAGKNPALGASPWPARAALACVGTGLLAVLVNLPFAALAELQLRVARAKEGSTEIETLDSGVLFHQAMRLDPLDPTPAYESAQYRLAVAMAQSPAPSRLLIESALEDLHVAQARAPRRLAFWRMESQVQALRARLTGETTAWQAAAEAMHRAIEIYPNRPDSYAELADVLIAEGSCPSAAQAVAYWQKALDLDAAKPAWEQFHRFNGAQREEIAARLAAARSWMAEECQ